MGTETIEFTLPVKNIKNKMKMSSPEGGTTWSTVTPERRSKSNSYLTAYMLKVKAKGLQMPMTSWQSAFSSSSLGYLVKVKSTLHPCFGAGLVDSEPGHQPLMILYGCSGTGDCLTIARDELFGHLLPDATGTPPPKTREYIKKMIAIIECDTPTSKDRWIGHLSISPRYLVQGKI